MLGKEDNGGHFALPGLPHNALPRFLVEVVSQGQEESTRQKNEVKLRGRLVTQGLRNLCVSQDVH